MLSSGFLEGVPTTIVDQTKFPKLFAHRQLISANPVIKAYYDSKKKTQA